MTFATGRKVLVLGGNGFIGRHAVAALRKAGAAVTIGSRYRSAESERIRLQERLTPADWAAEVERFDAIVNCVGILRQRPGESYADLHHKGPAALAAACANRGRRFVHVSALGLSAAAKSRFLLSKLRGEQDTRATGGDWVIARLSLLDGEGGYGAAWLRAVARLPIFVVPASARGKIAALTVEDAGEALARLAVKPAEELGFDQSREFELGGEQPLSFRDYILCLRRRHTEKPAIAVTVPGWLARIGAHLCDLLHFSPFSFGHWELLCADNVAAPNRLPALLNRAPIRVDQSSTDTATSSHH